MRIVFANRWYPPHSGNGGIAAYQRHAARALIERGHDVMVYAVRYDSSVPEIENDHGVRVQRELLASSTIMSRVPWVHGYARSAGQYVYGRRLARQLMQSEIKDKETVLEFAEVNAEAFTYLRNKGRCRTVVRCHTPTAVLRQYYRKDEVSPDTWVTDRLERACMLGADILSAPSRDMATVIENLLQLSSGSIHVIPNPVKTSLFTPPNHMGLTRRDERLRILHVGRLDRAKGMETIMHAVPEVVSVDSSIDFIFVGPDRSDYCGSTWKTRLMEHFRRYNVDANVTFLGEVDDAALRSEYRKAHMAIVPSILYESFSYTCAQALASGVPVIASRIGGIPETVGEGGLLVDPNNPDQLAENILALARDESRRIHLAQRALQQASTYDAARVAGLLEGLYTSLL